MLHGVYCGMIYLFGIRGHNMTAFFSLFCVFQGMMGDLNMGNDSNSLHYNIDVPVVDEADSRELD